MFQWGVGQVFNLPISTEGLVFFINMNWKLCKSGIILNFGFEIPHLGGLDQVMLNNNSWTFLRGKNIWASWMVLFPPVFWEFFLLPFWAKARSML